MAYTLKFCMHTFVHSITYPSQVNVVEALDVLAHSKADIAVITPYKAQKKLIEGKLKSKGMKPNWSLQTIDASQGTAGTSYVAQICC